MTYRRVLHFGDERDGGSVEFVVWGAHGRVGLVRPLSRLDPESTHWGDNFTADEAVEVAEALLAASRRASRG